MRKKTILAAVTVVIRLIHISVDSLGNPITFILTEGNRHDSPVALELLKEVSLARVNVVGDKVYGSTVIRDYITNQGGTYTIPPRKSTLKLWTVDSWIYKERHSIECFFDCLKHFRRIATRYDKTTYVFRKFLHTAAILLRLR